MKAVKLANRLKKALWPVWSKNNWLDVKRRELPESVTDLSMLTHTCVVNEYQSSNIIISNLKASPLALRVLASNMSWFDPEANLLGKHPFSDTDSDGKLDGWNASAKLAVADGTGISLKARTTLIKKIKLRTGGRYLLYFKARMKEGGASLNVSIINEGWRDVRGATAAFADSEWHIISKMITAPTGEKEIVLRTGDGGEAYLKDLALVPYESTATFDHTAPELRVADYQELRGGGVRADPLLPMGTAGRLDVPSGESRRVWLTFKATDIPPGICYGKITIRPMATAEERRPTGKTVDFEQRRVPLRIAASPSFAVYNWDYAESEKQVEDMYRHKVNIFLCGMPWPEYDKNGDVVSTDYSEIDRYLRMKIPYVRKSHGAIMFSYGVVRGFHLSWEKKYGWKFMGETWRKAFKQGVLSWLRHLDAIGLKPDEYYAQIYDEAMADKLEYVVEGGRMLRKIAPKVRWVMDGEQSVELAEKMSPYVDVWIPTLHSLLNGEKAAGLLKFYKSTGKPVWTYTCQVRMKALQPYKYYRLKPWNAASLGLQGVCYWAYNSWRGDPWNDFDSYRGDNGVVYRGADGGVVDSCRWEASREGIEDWQIIKLVDNIAKNIDETVFKKTRKRIDKAMKSVLSSQKDTTRAQKEIRKLIEIGIELNKLDPLKITRAENIGNATLPVIACESIRPAKGKLYYRLRKSPRWLTRDMPKKSKWNLKLEIPPTARLEEWTVVLWDDNGRVAFFKH